MALGLAVASSSDALAQDSDGDGVIDSSDAFPCEPAFAGVTFAPAEGAFGGLLFEDQWPNQGDLDFNDLAITYNYVLYTDGQGRVVQIDASFSALAVGGRYSNGLALTLPVPRTAISSVTRSIDRQGAALIAASTGDTNLTVVLSPNLRELFGDTADQINSLRTIPRQNSSSLEVSIMFSTPVALSVSNAPFDLFIFRANDPTHEIHRPQYSGSSRMNVALFGTADDASTSGRSFVDTSGLPFVVMFPDAVPYPAEGVAISSLYPAITSFASSGGTESLDFYTSPVAAHAYADVGGQGPLSPAALNPLTIDRTCVPVQATTVTFEYTGSGQTWVVPNGVTSVRIESWGAAGGNGYASAIGGLGAYAMGTVAVTAGQTLNVVVGQAGGHGTGSSVAGGGGGGGSFISRNGSPLVIAGGGGGASYQGGTHGQPGLTTQTGGAGGYYVVAAGQGGFTDNGGGGGLGGGGGGWNASGASNNWITGGQLRGGAGGSAYSSYGGYGGFGGGGGSMHGGGGGGGYSGGSGGSYNIGGGGGGSYNLGTSPTAQAGVRAGNGRVIFHVAGNTGNGTTGNLTFAATGAVQTFTVPASVFNLTIAASGAQGGNGRNGATGGRGAYAEGRVMVTPGQVLSIVVGRAGGNGTGSSVAGGGGGGGSFVYVGSTPLIIAGGGGGGSYAAPGNTHGQPGLTSETGGAGGYYSVAAGLGGFTDNGGGGGLGAGGGGWNGTGTTNNWVTGGQLRGGAGGAGYSSYGGDGGFGGGGGSMHGGGGGGGYSGGSGGSYSIGGGGGGSYTAGAVNVVARAGDRSGDGTVVLSW